MCVCSPSQQGNGDLSAVILHHQGHLGDFSKLAKFISDFEKAVFGGVYCVLPDIDQRGLQRGLQVSFNSADWKNIGDKGTSKSFFFYRNPSFQEVFYMLLGLSFVPVDKVQTFYYTTTKLLLNYY